MKTGETREVMTVEQAAERWQMNPEALRRLCQKGSIKAFKVGKQWRIPRKENEVCGAK